MNVRTVIGIGSAILGLTANAAGVEGLYATVDAGVNLVDDIEPSAPGSRVVSLDPGFRISGGVGYRFFTNHLLSAAVEGETGFLYNEVKSVTGVFPTTSGHFWQIPFLVNGVVTFLPESRFKPYIGVGGGGVRGRLDIGGNSGDETDGALQGMAGVRYKLNDRGDLSLGYKGLITFPKGIDRITSHAIVASYTFAF